MPRRLDVGASRALPPPQAASLVPSAPERPASTTPAKHRSRRPSVLLVTPCLPPARGGIERTSGRLIELLGAVELSVVAGRPGVPGEGVAWRNGMRLRLTRNRPPGGRQATAHLNAGAAYAAIRGRVDIVLALHIRAMPSARAAAVVRGARTIVVVHAREMAEQPRLARAAMAWADRVVAVSTYAREFALTAGAEPSRVDIIHPGVDLAPTDPTPPRAREGPPTIVTVSRLDDRFKGHDVLLRALALIRDELPDVRWSIVGDGPLRSELERAAGRLGLGDAVTFHGGVNDAERDALLDRAHVFCMLSRVPKNAVGEGFGIAYVEAGAHGLPVVAGRVPGVVDAVTDGVTGILVDPTSPGAVAQALVAVLSNVAAADLGAAGRVRARALAWPLVANRYLRSLERALEQPPRRPVGVGFGWLADLATGPRPASPQLSRGLTLRRR